MIDLEINKNENVNLKQTELDKAARNALSYESELSRKTYLKDLDSSYSSTSNLVTEIEKNFKANKPSKREIKIEDLKVLFYLLHI